MRLIFLGFSGGIQTSASGNTSFVLVDGNITLLIDVSGNPSGSLSAYGIDPLGLNAIFLTHAHIDHLYGLPSLIHNLWLMGRTAPLQIFSNPHTLEVARKLCGVFELERKPQMFPISWQELSSSTLHLGELSVDNFSAKHGQPTTGFIFSSRNAKLVYTSDTAPIEDWVNNVSGASAIIHEASGLISVERQLNLKGHSSSRQAAKDASVIASMSPAQPKPILFLCHLPPGSDEIRCVIVETQSSYAGPVVLPEIGRSYDLE